MAKGRLAACSVEDLSFAVRNARTLAGLRQIVLIVEDLLYVARNVRIMVNPSVHVLSVVDRTCVNHPVLELASIKQVAKPVGAMLYVEKTVQMQEVSRLVASFAQALHCVEMNVQMQAS
jgi:hypothetical protein